MGNGSVLGTHWGIPDNEGEFLTQDCVLPPKTPILRRLCTKQRILLFHFECLNVRCLAMEAKVLEEVPLFQVIVYVSKGGCAPINLLKMPRIIN